MIKLGYIYEDTEDSLDMECFMSSEQPFNIMF